MTSDRQKLPFVVLAGDDHFAEVCLLLLKRKIGIQREVRLVRFQSENELLGLADGQFFDLIFLYIGNIQWEAHSDQLSHVVKVLLQLRADYGKPIIALQGMDWGQHFADTGVSFLTVPFTTGEFLGLLERLEAKVGSSPDCQFSEL